MNVVRGYSILEGDNDPRRGKGAKQAEKTKGFNVINPSKSFLPSFAPVLVVRTALPSYYSSSSSSSSSTTPAHGSGSSIDKGLSMIEQLWVDPIRKINDVVRANPTR